MRLLIILFLLHTAVCLGQTKIEIEKRIPSSQVPNNAVKFINTNYKVKKIKWFLEQSETGTSYEAKFKFNKKHYSLEFSKNGNLEDTEIRIDYKSLADAIKLNINYYLSNKFIKYRILKTQLQLVPKTNKETKTNYEIVLLGKTEQNKMRYEFTFNASGHFVSSKEIKETNYIYLQN